MERYISLQQRVVCSRSLALDSLKFTQMKRRHYVGVHTGITSVQQLPGLAKRKKRRPSDVTNLIRADEIRADFLSRQRARIRTVL